MQLFLFSLFSEYQNLTDTHLKALLKSLCSFHEDYWKIHMPLPHSFIQKMLLKNTSSALAKELNANKHN